MKSSFNRRALRLLTVLAILFGTLIVTLFFFVAQGQIKKRATKMLKEFAVAPEGTWEDASLEIYAVSTADIGTDGLMEIEQRLLAYYTQHRDYIPFEKICHLAIGKSEAYFFARASGQSGEQKGSTLLIYTDVSFASGLVKTAAMIMTVVVLVLSVVLYCVQRYTVKVLDDKDRGMREFFANASHELKTPLMAIRSYADGLEKNLVAQDKACIVIKKETDRMTVLVNGILEFSKLDSGTVQPHIAENDVREILYDAIQVIEPTVKQKGIELALDLPEPILLDCDEDMLFSAFSNILTNCIRYVGHRITVKASRQKSYSSVNIWIANDGQLISKQDASHAFERFYQGSNGQTGIGLALSREYIILHKGNISVSAKNGETVFEITL